MTSGSAPSPLEEPSAAEPVRPELAELRAQADRVRLVASIGDLLYWDDRAHRPVAAGDWRAMQREWCADVLHDQLLSPGLERSIAGVEERLPGDREAVAMRREVTRARRLPQGFSGRFQATASRARAAWDDARAAGRYSTFAPHLDQMCELARESAELHGYEREPYEAVLETWEPGVDVEFVQDLFAQLRAGLAPMLELRPRVTKELTLRPLPDAGRHALEADVLEAVGFDPTRGRIVESSRAFCIALAPHDVRMTTRFHETPWLKGIHSTLHEAGHAIYAQAFGRLGVPSTLAAAPGLGLDESQSRLVENVIGRSHAFCEWLLERVRLHCPEAGFEASDLPRLYTELNTAEHPCRRLGTDELSYNLHIEVRFVLERALINGDLSASDLPDAWADAVGQILGERPTRDADGCLQDVHWSLGQWGYFPTYMLGNVYALQLVEHARRNVPELEDEIRQTGGSPTLRAWLDEHVYREGRRWSGRELVERVTGSAVSADPLLAYLHDKFVTRAGEFARD